jgi:hypothetical protein
MVSAATSHAREVVRFLADVRAEGLEVVPHLLILTVEISFKVVHKSPGLALKLTAGPTPGLSFILLCPSILHVKCSLLLSNQKVIHRESVIFSRHQQDKQQQYKTRNNMRMKLVERLF